MSPENRVSSQSSGVLPAPLTLGVGWPFEGSPITGLKQLSAYPRITVVTPSYNQGRFLEQTIRSVLLQNYPNLEYFVIDGGSNDESVSVIEHYAPWIHYWHSEPDRGQSHAINTGLAMATGDLVAWLNSDDMYFPGTLLAIAEAALNHPEAVLIYGEADLVYEDGSLMEKNYSKPYDKQIMLKEGNPVPQPSAFIRRQILKEVGDLDESLHFTMDYDLWFRLGDAGKVIYLEQRLSMMRTYPEAKTSSGDYRFFTEVRQVAERYGGRGLPVLHREWLIQIHWRKLYAAYAKSDWQAGQRELSYIMQSLADWTEPNDLSQRLLDRLWEMVLKNRATEAEVAQVGLNIGRHLPPDVSTPRAVCSSVMTRLYQAFAFRYYDRGQFSKVLPAVVNAVRWDWHAGLNRGLWAIGLRSLGKVILPSPTANHAL